MVPGYTSAQVCPFFERRDRRCARLFNLNRLAEIFDNCLGEYESCHTYHEIRVSPRPEKEPNAVAQCS